MRELKHFHDALMSKQVVRTITKSNSIWADGVEKTRGETLSPFSTSQTAPLFGELCVKEKKLLSML